MNNMTAKSQRNTEPLYCIKRKERKRKRETEKTKRENDKAESVYE